MRTSIFRVRIFRPRKFKSSVCVQICSVQISEICSVFNKLLKTLRVVGLRDLTYQANLQLSFSRCLAIRKILSPGSSTRINPPPNLARLSFGALIILWFMVALLWHCMEKILLLRSASRCNHRSLLCLFHSLHLQRPAGTSPPQPSSISSRTPRCHVQPTTHQGASSQKDLQGGAKEK